MRRTASARRRAPAAAVRTLAAGVVCLVAALCAASPGVAEAAEGAISGTVTASANNAPLKGAEVKIYTAEGEYVTNEETAADGTYTVSGLPEYSYKVEFVPPEGSNYLTQFYNDKASLEAASVVEVKSGETTKEVNAKLASGGEITGTVEGPRGEEEAAPEVEVQVYNTAHDLVASGQTLLGTYAIQGLSAGSYVVEFVPAFGEKRLAYQFYGATYAFTDATHVSVSASHPATGIDAKLPLSAIIEGEVADALTEAPLEDVEVQADDITEPDFYPTPVVTSSSGIYVVEGLAPGSYKVEFTPSGGYSKQYYKDKSTLAEATEITVKAGEGEREVEAKLTAGGRISGTVTSAATTDPLDEVALTVFNSADEPIASGQTNAEGKYTVLGLATGSYTVEFLPSSGGYAPQYYDDKSTLAEATKVEVTAGGAAAEANAALAAEGSIKGTVKAASNSADLGGIEVLVYDSAEQLITSAQSEPDGTYTVPGLAAGNYEVQFVSPSGEYVSQYYDNQAKFSEATKVPVAAGVPTSPINAEMATADGSLSGEVTSAANHAAVPDVVVKVYEAGVGHVASATSESDGDYKVSGLAPGSYEIEFVAPSAAYLTQYYGGGASLDAATPVPVAAGSNTAEIDTALKAPGGISGKVTNAAKTADLEGVEVEVFGSHGELLAFPDTAANGTYSVSDLATGSYVVEFVPTAGYLGQYYNGAFSLAQASRVSVTAGSVTSGVNAALTSTGAISGTVTSASSHEGLADVEVQVYAPGGEFAGSAKTGSNGTYTVSGLAPGGYLVEFVALSGGDARQFYDEASLPTEATGVSVSGGETTSNVNAALNASGAISGKVTRASNAEALEGVEVEVYDSGGDPIASAQTGSGGTYTVSGLPAGSYAVGFSPTSGNYLAQYYNDKPTLAEATTVTVAPGATKSAINAALAAGGEISGTVYKPGGSVGATEIEVAVYSASDSIVASATTAADGTYTVEGLPQGSYDVQFTPLESHYPDHEYAPQYYSGAALLTEATAVAVVAGSDKAGVNATLAAPGAIAGTVEGAASAKLGGVVVKVFNFEDSFVTSAETGSAGTYTIPALAAGSYAVQFVPSASYLPQYYKNVPSYTEATEVVVKPGKTDTEISAVLVKPGAISGTVTNSSNTHLEDVEVKALNAGGESVASTHTVANGSYTISGLTEGSYKVQFVASTGNYAPQYYNNKPRLPEAAPVTVTAGHTTSAINAVLAEGGKIKGTVTDANTHAALADIAVVAYETERNAVATTETAAGGTYTLSGLATDHDKVEFSAPSGDYLPQYYDNASSYGEATELAITAGATTEMVNAAMVSAYGSLSGTVTNASSHVAIEHVEVKVYDSGDDYVSSVETGANGDYSVSGLPTGEYEVEFLPTSGDYLRQYSQDKSTLAEATAVPVTAGSTKTGVNAALVVGGGISGTVTTASSDAPLANVLATVYDSSDARVAKAETAANGQYTVSGLAPGQYEVEFAGGGSYVPQFYKEGTLLVGATSVTVTAEHKTEQINGALVVGGSISGTVTDALTGLPLAEVQVNAYTSGGTLVESESGETASDGTYRLATLVPGSYEVQFVPPSEFFFGQFFSGASSLLGATQVSVKEGLPTEGINAAIVPLTATTTTTTSTSTTATATSTTSSETTSSETTSSATTSSATTGATTTPTLSLAGPITSTASAVLVPLECSPGSGTCATAVVKVTIVETLSKGRLVAVAAKHSSKLTKRTVVVGMLSATLSAGEKKIVSVALSSTAKKLLALHKKLAVEVQVVSDGTALKTQVILIKPAKSKPKPKKKHF